METPIKDLLRDKYQIDVDKSELQELISKQVDQELLKRLDKPDRQQLNQDSYFKDLQQSLVGVKENLSSVFSRDFIMQQVNGVKEFFKDHAISPDAIKNSIKDLVTWNKDSPTVENITQSLDKVRDIFTKEQEQISEIEKETPSLSNQFDNLKDMMKESYETINQGADIQSLRNYQDTSRLEIVTQTLNLKSDNENPYQFNKLNNDIDWHNQDNRSDIYDLYNYLKDAQNNLKYSEAYPNSNNIEKLQLEQFTLQGIQTIEEQISPKELNESRIEHLANNNNQSKPQFDNLKDFSKSMDKIEKTMPDEAKNKINESVKDELEQNNIIKEGYNIQETEVFQTLNEKNEYNELASNKDDKQVVANLLDVDQGKAIVEVGDEQYTLTLNEADTKKIENNQDAFTFNFDTETNEFNYLIDEDAIEEPQQSSEQDNEKKSHTPEQQPEPSPLPQEYIDMAENDDFER